MHPSRLILFLLTCVACTTGAGSASGPVNTDAAGAAWDAANDGQGVAVYCDPTAQTGCATGEKCNLFCGASGPEFGCRPDQGTIGSGQPCVAAVNTGQDMCVRGTTCGSTIHGTVCTPFCAGDAGCGARSCATVRAVYPCFSDPTMNKPFSITVCQ
jgi:hypothetical protein